MKNIKKISFALITILFLVILINTKTYATSVPELKNKYPTGMQWNDKYHGWSECAGFAALMYDEYYGLNPIKYASQTKDSSQIKAGDIVRYNGHSVWVTAKNGDVLTIAECNYDWNNHVRWDQTRYISNISGSLEYIMQAPWAIGTTPPALGSPTTASVDTSDGVKISWSKVDYSTGYQIKIYNSKNEIVQDFETTNRGVATTNVFGLATDSYTVRVYAKRYDVLSTNYAFASFSCEQEATTYTVKPEHLMVEVGKTAKFEYNLYPTGGNAECYFFNAPNRTNTNIATVDREGNVTGVSEGSTYVSFHFRNSRTTEERGTYKVTVVKGINFTENTKTLKIGDTYKINVASMPNEYSSLRWRSSYSEVATVDQDGNVTAVSPGTVAISLKALVYDSDEKNTYTYVSDVCEVTVREPEPEVNPENVEINLSKSSYTFKNKLESLQLSANLNVDVDTKYTWKSSNEKILKVDQNGKVTPVSAGFADITVKDNKYGKEATCSCYVQTLLTLSDGSKAYVGDMNRDGVFDASDSTFVLEAYKRNATADEILVGDIDANGVLDASDASLILELFKSEKFKPGAYYPATNISLNKNEISLNVNNTETLKATIEAPQNTTDSLNPRWNSSNKSIATVDSNGKVIAKSRGTTTITATTTNGKTATCKVTVSSNTPSVKYRTHVQKEGWQNFVEDGTTSGTTGKSLRLEGIKIGIDGLISGGVKYSTHVQKEGWQNFVENGALSGTTGKSLRLEAIKIELTGEISKQYDIYYRVHAQKFGWMGWAKNGEKAGTQGYSYRLEGIQIKLVKKGENGPTSIAKAFNICPTIKYTSYVEKEGWTNIVSNGQTTGTTGKSLRMEALKINLNTNGIAGEIKYSAHVQNKGWQNFVTNGQVVGTTGKNLRMEAIKIELTEEISKTFDIYYRVHSEKFGWMGWAKNGEAAGTQGYGYRVEALQIQLLPKGSKPSGTTENAFKRK